MKLAIQSDRLGPIRFESDVCWRDSVSNLADSVIGGALRSPECQVDSWQRLLGDAVLQELEDDTYTGIQMQVRTMRLMRFPICGLPIQLDWRSAWTAAKWTAWTAGLAPEDTAELAKKVAVEACFDSDAPLSITYVACGDETRTTIDTATYELRSTSAGDVLALLDASCGWPTACGPLGSYIEIKYVVGFQSSDEFRAQKPNLLANIAAMFNYRFENPEMMGGNSSKTYELLTQYFRKHLKWRL